MARSPEYPDLPWMPPRSWTNADRTSVQLIVIHTTEGSARGQSAEDGAAYDQRRLDGTSAHYYVDDTSVVQCVRTADQAHTARAQGNRRGVQYELCGRSGSIDWGGTYAQAMLRRAAHQAARDCRKWGIPARKLSPDQVAAGVKGFCGHVDVTEAFPRDNGTHTDPGPRFPWDIFLDLVRAEIEEDDMPSAEDVWKADVIPNPTFRADAKTNPTTTANFALGNVWQRIGDMQAAVSALAAQVAAQAGRDLVDEPAIVAGVLAGLDPAAIAAAIPPELARQVADELAARLAS